MPRKNFAAKGRLVARGHSGGLPAPGAAAVVAPSPTFRGSLVDISNATSFAITPTSTPLGEVMLHVAFTDGTNITAPPTIATGQGGAGVTWRNIPPRGNEDATGGSTRALFLFWGHGTFDGSAITVVPADGATGECELHIIDWANTSTTKPFTKVHWTPLAGSNSSDFDTYQQRRIGSNNVLGGWIMNGGNNHVHTFSEGTILRHDSTGSVLSVSSIWHNTDFTNYKLNTSWEAAPSTTSSGGFLYEVQATDSDDGPNANIRGILDWTDAAGAIGLTAITPKPNEVVVFACVKERAANSSNFVSVTDDALNAYTLIGAVNLDADHRLMAYAFRYGATPGTPIISADSTGAAHTGCVGAVFGLLKEDGTALAGSTNTDWLVQAAVTNTATAGTSISATIPSIAQHSSVLAFLGNDLSTADFVPEQGFVGPLPTRDYQLTGHAYATATATFHAIWNAGNEDSTPSATCSSGDIGIIALEVA